MTAPGRSSWFPRFPRLSLTRWILVAMVVGVLVGWLAPGIAVNLKPLSTLFLRMIRSLVAPLIFVTLVVGIAGHGDDMKRIGRLALGSIIYFEIVTTAALVIGLLAANIAKPGAGVALGQISTAPAAAYAARHVSVQDLLDKLVPDSIVQAAASGEILQIVFFAVLFGVALTRIPSAHKARLLGGAESLVEVMFRLVDIVMWVAPIGIGAALAVTVGQSGLGVLVSLGKLVLTLYAALIVLMLGVFVPIAILARVPLRAFVRAVREPAIIAFSTSTSEAALPRAMEAMEAMGVPKRIVAFVMPTGYSFNLTGSTLYLAVTALFCAQAAGITMPLSRQLVMMLTLMLTSKGIAGVPRGGFVVLSGAVASFGLPLEGVALVLGVDAFMDMARTMVNVVGNCLATAVMATVEGERATQS